MADFEQGALVRSEATFVILDVEDDPDEVLVDVTPPDGTVTTYVYGTGDDVVRFGAGRYRVSIDTTDQPGPYRGRWHSTGNGQGAKSFSFDVAAADT